MKKNNCLLQQKSFGSEKCIREKKLNKSNCLLTPIFFLKTTITNVSHLLLWNVKPNVKKKKHLQTENQWRILILNKKLKRYY